MGRSDIDGSRRAVPRWTREDGRPREDDDDGRTTARWTETSDDDDGDAIERVVEVEDGDERKEDVGGTRTEDVGAPASVARGSRARTALWVSCAVRAVQALSGAPFKWFGKNAAQLYFASDDGTLPFFSMSMWCAVIHARTALETLIVLRHGEERVEERWVCGLAMGNYLQAGLLMFEGAQGRGVGRHIITLDSFAQLWRSPPASCSCTCTVAVPAHGGAAS